MVIDNINHTGFIKIIKAIYKFYKSKKQCQLSTMHSIDGAKIQLFIHFH